MKWTVLISLIVALASSTSAAETVRLLTIGNSFSVNSTKYLADIAKASECTLVKGMANLGGCSLERHWKHAAAHEADPNDPEGKPYRGRSLRQILETDDWDVATIQQLSTISDDIDAYRPYAKNLYNYIRKYAPNAEIIIHQTWAYRVDDTKKYRGDYNQAAMHEKVRKNYHAIADELGIRIIPVGEAFANARNHPDWNFVPDPDFNPVTAIYPERPQDRHSLCAGFAWKEWLEPPEMSLDTHHASDAGQYLGAAVFFETLFDKSILGNDFIPDEVPTEDIRFLQEIAHKTVASGK